MTRHSHNGMRICFFTHYTTLYGANRSLLNLIDGLVPLGVQPFVVVPDEGDITTALQERRIPFLVTPHQRWSSAVAPGGGLRRKIAKYIEWRRVALWQLMTNLRVMPDVVRQLKEWDIDAIYTNSSVIPMGAMVALWMRKPHVWHLREFGYRDYQLTRDWGNALTDFVLRRATAHICISEAIRTYYENVLAADKNYVVYNGIATRAEFDLLHEKARKTKKNGENYFFAIVGLIHPNKGQDLAIQALSLLRKEFPNACLVIAGDGDAAQLKSFAASLGITNAITFLGHVNNPFDVYLRTDALLMCSTHEGMGRVTVEAMAACRPVIGYDNAGTSEIVEHENTGLLFRGGAADLAACMRKFVEDPLWAKQLGENGWKIAREKYCIETYSKKIYDILSVVSGKDSQE